MVRPANFSPFYGSNLGGDVVLIAETAARFSVVSKTTTYTAKAKELVLCDTSGGGFTVTLPSAVPLPGASIVIKKTSADGNTLTVATTSSQTIDGLTTQAWTTQHDALQVTSDGANWRVT